jgi:hypothetical protein
MEKRSGVMSFEMLPFAIVNLRLVTEPADKP